MCVCVCCRNWKTPRRVGHWWWGGDSGYLAVLPGHARGSGWQAIHWPSSAGGILHSRWEPYCYSYIEVGRVATITFYVFCDIYVIHGHVTQFCHFFFFKRWLRWSQPLPWTAPLPPPCLPQAPRPLHLERREKNWIHCGISEEQEWEAPRGEWGKDRALPQAVWAHGWENVTASRRQITKPMQSHFLNHVLVCCCSVLLCSVHSCFHYCLPQIYPCMFLILNQTIFDKNAIF